VKLVSYDRRGHRRLGALTVGRVVDLPDAVGHPAFPTTLESLIRNHGGTVLDVAQESLEREDVMEFDIPEPRILSPVLPSSVRCFQAFEEHARLAAKRRGGRLSRAWSAAPLYSRREHRAVLGPDEELEWPAFSEDVDFECQVGCIVGSWGRNLAGGKASQGIFGYVLVNDWVARDVERAEVDAGVGSGKSRDFALSLGPWVATADELDPRSVELAVRVDGDLWAEGSTANMRWDFSELVKQSSADEEVWPGDLLTSGPFEGGCAADLGRQVEPGSTVEFEGTGLGMLRTKLRTNLRARPRRISKVS
jgi:2-keto-4-pentenoate hydratase/2-oxohepta-3-ene-1,7-dioic acid hydratase in catechol pathway